MSARADNEAVTRAYLRRITGYDVTEVKSEYKVNEEGELELTKKTEKVKHVPGDPRAAEFWLVNRQRRKWRPTRLLDEEGEGAREEPGVIEIAQVAQEPEDEGEEERDG